VSRLLSGIHFFKMNECFETLIGPISHGKKEKGTVSDQKKITSKPSSRRSIGNDVRHRKKKVTLLSSTPASITRTYLKKYDIKGLDDATRKILDTSKGKKRVVKSVSSK
jgi:hypothetical protein